MYTVRYDISRMAQARTGQYVRCSGNVSAQTPSWLRGRMYVRTYPGASWGYSYVHGTEVTVCTGDSCYAEVGFNTIMYYVLQSQPSEKINALSLRDKQELRRTTDTGQYSVLRCLRKICKRTQSRLAPSSNCNSLPRSHLCRAIKGFQELKFGKIDYHLLSSITNY